MKTHQDGTQPTNGELFVFGSNLAGIHGAGAARAARQLFGAEWGKGVGYTGRSFAIPTKDKNIESLTLGEVARYIASFNLYVRNHPDTEFFLTRVGCGLAGFRDDEIAPFFEYFPNVNYPEEWVEYIKV